jgi:hypothetical protein
VEGLAQLPIPRDAPPKNPHAPFVLRENYLEPARCKVTYWGSYMPARMLKWVSAIADFPPVAGQCVWGCGATAVTLNGEQFPQQVIGHPYLRIGSMGGLTPVGTLLYRLSGEKARNTHQMPLTSDIFKRE